MEAAEEPEPTEAEVLAHLAVVAHRVAVRIAETIPDGPERDAAVAAAAEVLLDDEGARDLLAAAFEEGVGDARRSAVLRGGAAPKAPDWSDVESVGERRAIAREEHACNSCSRSPVCAVAAAARQLDLLLVLRRCDRYG